MVRIITLTANSVDELDNIINKWLKSGAELSGEMQVYKEMHNHAVTKEEIWDNVFSQRVTTKE